MVNKRAAAMNAKGGIRWKAKGNRAEMKQLGAVVLALILLNLRLGGALFGPGGINVNPSSFNDLTNILDCARDEGGSFDVPLVPPANGSNTGYWNPAVTEFSYPSSLNWASQNLDLLLELVTVAHLQGVNINLQSLTEQSFNEIENPDFCDNIRAQLTANGLDLIDDPDYIVENLIIDRVNSSSVGNLTFSTENIDSSNQQEVGITTIFRALECRVVHGWIDLGPTYIPRYIRSGRCFDKPCGVPVRNGQGCRPDTSEENLLRLPALRWDCCWELIDNTRGARSAPYTPAYSTSYDCGWRMVNVPILCDCDCSCPSAA